MATLTEIQLRSGSQVICEADEGSSAISDSLIKLTAGVQWRVTDPLKYLQRQVKITAKSESLAETKPLEKNMYITTISKGDQAVTLRNEPQS